MDFTVFYEKYESLVNLVDEAFEKVRHDYEDCVTCHQGCSDCCHALFDLTLIEAMYINDRFRKTLPEDVRTPIMEKANTVDRQLAKLKRKAYKRVQGGVEESVIVEEMAEVRMRCPLLDESDLCTLYAYRPITCRIYGAPTSINGKAHTCGLTGFDPGLTYPTIKLEAIQGRLFAISGELVRAVNSKYVKMDTMLVPLSMALITDYTDEYLGISAPKTPVEGEGGKGRG